MGKGVEQRGSFHRHEEVYAAERAEALLAEEVDSGEDFSWLSQNRRMSSKTTRGCRKAQKPLSRQP
jgi:hypothetical protein